MLVRRTLFSFICIILLSTVAGCKTGQATQLRSFAVDERAAPLSLERALTMYLTADCGTGESDPAGQLKAVVQFGQRAVKPLLTVVREGPPDRVRRELQRDARADFKRLRDFVQGDGLSALQDADVVAAAQELDERTYVAMRVDGFARAYRERSLNALVVLSDRSSLNELRVIARQPTLSVELQEAVSEAIRKIE